MNVSRRGFLAGLVSVAFAPKILEALPPPSWTSFIVSAPDLAVVAPVTYASTGSVSEALRRAYSTKFFEAFVNDFNPYLDTLGAEVPNYRGRRARWR